MTWFLNLLREEDGLALTEYLVLLGLLVGAIILAVIAFGDGLGGTYLVWAEWIGAVGPS